jgi:hypothetical protein
MKYFINVFKFKYNLCRSDLKVWLTVGHAIHLQFNTLVRSAGGGDINRLMMIMMIK